MTVTVLTDAQRAPFRAAAEQVQAKYVEMVGVSAALIAFPQIAPFLRDLAFR